MEKQLANIICLMGPTATGKTELAIKLKDDFPVEIVSVDSAMVYRHMDIGTAKPTPEELIKAPHHLINLRDPAAPYSAGDFRLDVERVIQSILKRGKIPLLVGGSMLYFHILQNGVAQLPSADERIRINLLEEAKNFGWAFMHKKLERIDPKIADQIHPNDSQRIQRALEVFTISGNSMSSLQKKAIKTFSNYRFINITLEPADRKNLHERIRKRFLVMLEKGFLDEVEQLWKREDLTTDLPSIKCVGYRQVWSYFDGLYDQVTLQEKIIVATRQLAKRQLTWLRHWNPVWRFYFEDNNCYQQIKIHLIKELEHENTH